MDIDVAKELLNELGASLEELEKQQGAVVQFLKEKGIVSDEQLGPYLEQAGNASSVRWRATRLRLERVFSTAAEKEEKAEKQRAEQAKQQTPERGREGAKRASKIPKEVARPGAASRGENQAEATAGEGEPMKDDRNDSSAAERKRGAA